VYGIMVVACFYCIYGKRKRDMNFRSVRFLTSTCVFAIITHINLAQAAGYTITDLCTLGGSSSSANDINEAKQVTGYSYTTTGYNWNSRYQYFTPMGTLTRMAPAA
jgi:hypothetical protein